MIKKCKNQTCQKEFKTYNSKRKFCSRKCFYEWLKKVSMDTEVNINTEAQENANHT